MTWRLRIAIAGAAALAGGVLVVLELDRRALSVARLSLVVSVGVVLVGAGLLAAVTGAERVGDIVVLGGAAWLVERLLQEIRPGSRGPPGLCGPGSGLPSSPTPP